MTGRRALLRTCACCPNQCRTALPPREPMQAESLTPSALALVALAVIDGQLANDASVREALGRTAPARACVPLCPYGHDVPTAIDEFLAELSRQAAKHGQQA